MTKCTLLTPRTYAARIAAVPEADDEEKWHDQTRIGPRGAIALRRADRQSARYTGEPVIVEKQGQPFVALISVKDLDTLERLRAHERQEAFSRRAARAAREAAYRERYGAA